MPTANRIAIHHGNDGLGQRPNPFVQIQHIQPWNPIGANVPSGALYVLIAARTKGFVARAGQHHHPNVAPLTANVHGINHFHVGLWPKGIVHLGAVYGDFRNPLKFLK